MEVLPGVETAALRHRRTPSKSSATSEGIMDESLLEEILRSLPQEVFQKSTLKALRTLTFSVAALVIGIYGLAIVPWFLLPLLWLEMGAAMCGVFAVAIDCGQQVFFRSKWLNDIVGWLCLLPVWYPFEAWRQVIDNKTKNITLSTLAHSPILWMLTSFWAWVKVNFWFGKVTKRVVFNLIALYTFICLFYPLMVYSLGLWGFFKYYLMPVFVFHFWMSSFLSTKYRVTDYISASIVALKSHRYPKWVEVLTNNLNYALSSLQTAELNAAALLPDTAKLASLVASPLSAIPTYNVKEAYTALRARFAESVVRRNGLELLSRVKDSAAPAAAVAAAVAAGPSSAVPTTSTPWWTRINWPTSVFLVVTPILAIYGIVACEHHAATWAAFAGFYLFGGLGITAGYHRLYSHRSYRAHWSVRAVLLTMATTAFESSCIDWCLDHRDHHRFTDTPKDPYNAKKGFWWSHMGWLMVYREKWDAWISDVSDLRADPLVAFQHRFYIPLSFFGGYGLPMLVCGLGWGDWWGGLLIAGVAKSVFILHCTFCINSVAHWWGDFTYSDQRTPRDSYFVSLFTFGEGYHNFHHEFPYDYRNGVFLAAYDPGKWLIWACEKLGLAWDVKRFDKALIQKGVIAMRQKKLDAERQALSKRGVQWAKAPESLPAVSEAELAKKLAAGGEWAAPARSVMIVDGIVHDLTGFEDEHPGGRGWIVAYRGKDVTEAFNGSVYNHSNAARELLGMKRIARVVKD